MPHARCFQVAVLAGAVALGTFGAAPARAQQHDVEQARTYFQAGAKAYDAGQYLMAVQAFEQAHRLAPRAGLVFSMAQAYRRQFLLDQRPEHLRAAMDKYREYLRADPQGNRRGDAAEALAELEQVATRLGVQGGEGTELGAGTPLARKTYVAVSTVPKRARVTVDGKPVPADSPAVEVEPGSHRIAVSAPGYFDEAQELPVPEGAMAALHFDLREKPATLELRTDEGAQVYLDGRPVGLTPLPSPLELPAGSHFVAVSRNGRSGFSEELVLARGEVRQLDVELDVTAQRITSYIFFGAAAAAAVTGGIFTGVALYQQRQAKDIQEEVEVGAIEPARLAEYNDSLRQRDGLRAVAGVGFGAALLAGAAGLLLYSFDQPTLEAPPRPSGPEPAEPDQEPTEAPSSMEIGAAPLVLPAGAAVTVRVRF